MFGFRFASVAVAALLFGASNAAPVHNPQYGEVVHVAPDRTSGGSVGTGGSIPHPHIYLGQDGGGNSIVAPVTHNAADHLKPHMPSPNEHGLGGVVRLDHVVAHPADVQRSRGPLRDAVLSHHATSHIENAKALVQAHYGAAGAHTAAAQAHRGHEAYHDQQSAHYFQHGNAQMGAYHAGQAAIHRGHAEAHETAAAHHWDAGRNVNGPNAAEHQRANLSAQHAHSVAGHLANLSYHTNNAAAYAASGNHHAAEQERQAAAGSHASAVHASTHSVHHANLATGH